MKQHRPERDAERLRSLLTRRDATETDQAERAKRTLERGRRDRRRRLVTGGVLAAVAAAVIITPQLLNKSRTTDLRRNVAERAAVTQPGDPGAAADPLSTTPCPDQPVLLPDDLGADASIGGEATSIRLCVGNVAGSGQTPRWSAPVDALTVGASSFFEKARSLPARERHRCDVTRADPDPYVFLVGFSDGSVDRVYVSSSCTAVIVMGTPYPSGAVLDVFLKALGEQRGELRPGRTFGVPGTFSCTDADQSGPLLTRGPAVTSQTRFDAFATCRQEAVGADAVDALNRAWPSSTLDPSTEQTRKVDRCPTAAGRFGRAVGVTSWGDVVGFELRGCGSYLVGGFGVRQGFEPGQRTGLRFLPSDSLSERLGLPHG